MGSCGQKAIIIWRYLVKVAIKKSFRSMYGIKEETGRGTTQIVFLLGFRYPLLAGCSTVMISVFR